MNEKPSRKGQCRVHISVGPESGDNDTIMRCQFRAGHGGRHKETFPVRFAHETRTGYATITWYSKTKGD